MGEQNKEVIGLDDLEVLKLKLVNKIYEIENPEMIHALYFLVKENLKRQKEKEAN